MPGPVSPNTAVEPEAHSPMCLCDACRHRTHPLVRDPTCDTCRLLDALEQTRGARPSIIDAGPPVQPPPSGSVAFGPLGGPTPKGLIDDPWMHRASKMRCGTCLWFIVKAPSMDFGRCRRHAPTFTGWPAVYVSDWCGDHRLSEEHA